MSAKASQIDQKELLSGNFSSWNALAEALYPGINAEAAITDAELNERLRPVQTNPESKPLINQVKSLLKSGESLAAEQQVLIDFIERSFNTMAMEKRIATEIGEQLLLLKPLYLRLLLNEANAFNNKEHPALKIIKIIIKTGFAWNNTLGRAGEPYLKMLSEQRQWLSFSYLNDSGVFNSAIKQLEKYQQQHQEKTGKLENRICDNAIGLIEAQKNRFISIRQINRLLGNKEYPREIIDFLQSPWKDSLQIARSQSNKPDEVSLEYAKVAGTLIWTCSVEAQKDKPKFYETTEALKPRLVEKLLSIHQEGEREKAIVPIKKLHLQLSSNSEVMMQVATPIPEDEIFPGVSAKVSPQILKRVQEIQIGQYFRVKTKDGKLRIIKLILKSEDARLLIFSNFTGVKALEMNYAEFSWLLSNNQAKAINPADIFQLSWQKAIRDIVENAKNKATSSSNTAHSASAPEDKTDESVIASKAKALSEAQEIEKTETQHADIPTELNVGSWLELSKENEEPIKIKLAAHIASMDRYVFVDRDGKKVGQYNHKEMEQLFLSGQLILIAQGNKFETFDKLMGNITNKSMET